MLISVDPGQRRAADQRPGVPAPRAARRPAAAQRRRARRARRRPARRARSSWSSSAATARAGATGSQQVATGAVPVDDVVDTTGAGDAFAAGFLSAWPGDRRGARWRRARGSPRRRSPKPAGARLALTPMNRILFVCMGNICRSPTAEGVMRRLVRDAGSRARVRDRQRRHRRLARRRPARPPRHAGRGGARRSCSRAPPARCARATSSTSTSCWRWTARTCASCGRSRPTATSPARRGCCASSTPPAPATPTRRARPVLRRPGRLRDRCSTRSRPPAAACSTPAVSLAARVSAATGAGRCGGSSGSAAATSTTRSASQFADESFAFVKTRADVAPGEYAAEAAGLRWLAEPGGLRVPEVLGVADDVLVLDWVDEGAPRRRRPRSAPGLADGATRPARRALRRRSADRCGSARSRCPTSPRRTGRTFYAEHRLLPLCPHAGLTRAGNRAVERVCARIARPRRPARAAGAPARRPVERQRPVGPRRPRLADRPRGLRRPPRGRSRDAAAVRLARPAFLAAYEERLPLAPGHEERVPLYQLFPLLVHAALFGGGYPASAERAAGHYV